MKRCSRQKWLVKSQQAKADAILTSPHSLSANVRNGADVLTKVLQDRKEKSALHLSKYVTDASKNLARSRGRLALWPAASVSRDQATYGLRARPRRAWSLR